MNPIPKPVTVNTGEQWKVQKTIDDFFLETKEFAEKTYDLPGFQFEIKLGEIAYHDQHISDDRLTYLLYGDWILAGVLETRTEFNYVHYTFFRDFEGFEEHAKGLKGL